MTTHDCAESSGACALQAVLKASRTRKMPCASTPSSNASDCPARRLGLCSMPCYGRGGMYGFPTAKALRDHNRAVIADCLTLPASEAIPAIARVYGPTVGPRATHHRLHDTGDCDNLEHVLGLVQLAHQRPTVQFWLPTHRADLLPWLSPAGMPSNMLVRLSARGIGDAAPLSLWPWTSISYNASDGAPSGPGIWVCPGNCREHNCRACWAPDVPVVAYRNIRESRKRA
jgi:hypothetical protein